MTTYIQDQYPKSRLTLTYLTQVDGQLVPESLPFRVRLLGDFSGRGPNDPNDAAAVAASPTGMVDPDMQPPPKLGGSSASASSTWPTLDQIDVISIPKGTRYEDALAPLGIVWRISHSKFPNLFAEVEGHFKAPLTLNVDDALDDFSFPATSSSTSTPSSSSSSARTAHAMFPATGTLTFEGAKFYVDPNTGKTNFDRSNGLGDFSTDFDVTVPIPVIVSDDGTGHNTTVTIDPTAASSVSVTFAGAVSGDITGDVIYTQGAPATGKLSNPPSAPVQGGTGAVLSLTLEGQAWMKLTLPITSLDSFTPDNLTLYIPEIRRLRLIANSIAQFQTLVLSIAEAKSQIRNTLTAGNAADQLKAARTALLAFEPGMAMDPPPSSTPASSSSSSSMTKSTPDALATTIATLAYPDAKINNQPFVQAVQAPNETRSLTGIKLFDLSPDITDADRAINCITAFFVNLTDKDIGTLTSGTAGPIPAFTQVSQTLQARLQGRINQYITSVLQDETFRTIERCWRAIDELTSVVTDDDVIVDVLDVSKYELGADLTDNSVDLFKSLFFKKLYQNEYDQYGGKPFSVMVGLYEFGYGQSDLAWIQAMSQVSNLAYCPFVAAAKTWEANPNQNGPSFFDCTSPDAFDQIESFQALFTQPKYGKWEAFRETPTAPFIGLTAPRYLLRAPWGTDPSASGNVGNYDELQFYNTDSDQWKDRRPSTKDFFWGTSATLFGTNLIKSYQATGWCQYIRGENGGGRIDGLTSPTVERFGRTEIQPPVEFVLPDYKELQLANAGFIPLIWKKDTATATFFSAQSAKVADVYTDDTDNENAQLVTNLSYTLSVSQIAHYIKQICRPYIGTSADQTYLQNLIETWLKGYVTTVVNPDDLTVQRYPFKAISVTVQPKPGMLGWYSAAVEILPHIQFEGMDVTLRLDATLGAATT